MWAYSTFNAFIKFEFETLIVGAPFCWTPGVPTYRALTKLVCLLIPGSIHLSI